MFFPPIQEIALAGLVKNAADSANQAAQSLKNIEEQNKETLKRIEAQNAEILRLNKVQPGIDTTNNDTKPPSSALEAAKYAAMHPTMLICSQCNNATPKKTKRCRHCGHVRPV